MRTPLGDIQIPPPGLSIGADIYRQYAKDEISARDYYIMSAAMVAGLAHEERPSIYPPLLPPIRSYIEGRSFGRTPLTPDPSKKLGDWIYLVLRALDHNSYVQEHLVWCKSKLEPVGLASECGLIDHALSRFASLAFPYADFSQARAVQKMDGQDRQRDRRA